MSTPLLSRRALLAGGSVLATTMLLPRHALAAGRVVTPAYPGPWEEAYRASRARSCARGLNGLTASFGSAFFERALADAAGRLAGLDVVGMLRANTLGLRPEAVHPGLTLEHLQAWATAPPPSHVAVRHTVGLLDPIVAADVPADPVVPAVALVPPVPVPGRTSPSPIAPDGLISK